MDFLEKDLEEIVFSSITNKSDTAGIQDRGLYGGSPFWAKRQVRVGNYGIADMVTFSRGDAMWGIRHTIRVWELKQNEINLGTLLQVNRYMTGIARWLKFTKRNIDHFLIEGVMVGRKVETNNDYVYLFRHIEERDDKLMGPISVYTYNYALDGLRFNSIEMDEYCLIDEGFRK